MEGFSVDTLQQVIQTYEMLAKEYEEEGNLADAKRCKEMIRSVRKEMKEHDNQ